MMPIDILEETKDSITNERSNEKGRAPTELKIKNSNFEDVGEIRLNTPTIFEATSWLSQIRQSRAM